MHPLDRTDLGLLIDILGQADNDLIRIAYLRSLKGIKKFVVRFLMIFIPDFLEKIDQRTMMSSIADAIFTLSPQSFEEIVAEMTGETDAFDKETVKPSKFVRIEKLKTLHSNLSKMWQLYEKRSCEGDRASLQTCLCDPSVSQLRKQRDDVMREIGTLEKRMHDMQKELDKAKKLQDVPQDVKIKRKKKTASPREIPAGLQRKVDRLNERIKLVQGRVDVLKQSMNRPTTSDDSAKPHGQHAERKAYDRQKAIREIGSPTFVAERMLHLKKLIDIVQKQEERVISEEPPCGNRPSPRSKA